MRGIVIVFYSTLLIEFRYHSERLMLMELSIYIQEGLSQELTLTRRVHRMGYRDKSSWQVKPRLFRVLP
jgi:hypothetical protein